MKVQTSGREHVGHGSATLAVVVLAGLIAGCAGTGPTMLAGAAPERHELKDGTTLLVDANGGMRMFASNGSMVHMKGGVPMETQGGTVIVMKENVLWKQLREFGTLSPKSR